MTSPSSTSSSDADGGWGLGSSLLVREWRTLRVAGARLALWLGVAAALVVAADRFYGSVPMNPYDRRMQDLRARTGELEILVVGTSQLYEGVNPQYLGAPAFNMASRSQDPYYDAQILERFAPDMPRLRVVVWGLSTFSFGYDLGMTKGEERLRRHFDPYFPRRDGSSNRWHRWSSLLRLRGDDPIKAFLKLIETRRRDQFRKTWPHADGFANEAPMAEKTDDGATRARFHESACFRESNVERNMDLMIRVARALEARGVRVVFVAPPVASTYRLSARVTRTFESGVARLLAETGAEYVDFSDLVPTGQQYFRNSDHLQGEGTLMFTRALGAYLTKPPPGEGGAGAGGP